MDPANGSMEPSRGLPGHPVPVTFVGMRRFLDHIRKGRAATLLAALFCTAVAHAQPVPISVSLVLMPPYPIYADEVLDMGDNTLISLQNNNPFESYTIYLGSTLDGSNGVNIQTRPEARPQTPIELAPGASLLLTGTELQAFYNNYNESDLLYSGITLEDLINDNALPEGLYTLCIRAYDFLTGIPLSGTAPQGCSAPFVVITADPPIITSPTNGQELPYTDPAFFTITWIPPTVSASDLVYRLEMMDITGLPINPYDAFLTGNMLQLSELDLPVNFFLYGMEYPQLLDGHEYAVRVRAYRQFGSLSILNNGWSDVVVFTYGTPGAADPFGGDGDVLPPPPPTDPGSVVLTDGTFPGTYDCASPCNVAVPPATDLRQNLRNGDLVNMGHFILAITQVSGTGTFSGQGVIQPTGYLPIGIKVQFSGLKVNNNDVVVAGQAEAMLRSDSWIDQSWADLSTNVRNVRFSRNRDVAWQQATDPQWYIDQAATVMQNTGSTLPFSIGPESGRLQVVGMHFFPDRAAYNVAHIQRLADDLEEPRYLSFLGKNFCLTPGGPAVGEDQAVLELVEEVRFRMTGEVRLAFDPANAQGAGTRATFDCNGLVRVDVQGRALFDPALFKPVNAAGQTTNDTLFAAFAVQYVDWGDWQAMLDFNAMGQSAANVVGFQYKELQGYTMQVQQAFIDHSISANLQGMQFPQGHPGAQTPEWEGIYIERLQVVMPRWANRTDTANHRATFAGRDLIIDDTGFSGRFAASGVLPRNSGLLDNWNFSIDTLHFEIAASSLVGGALAGNLRLPIADDDLVYVASVDYAGNNTLHSFALASDNDSLSFDVWHARFILEDNSGLAITLGSGAPLIEATLNGRISFASLIGPIDKNKLTDITIEQLVVRNRPSYISIGNFGTGLSTATLAVAGFGVLIDQLDFDASDMNNAKLLIGLGMDLSQGVMPISGGVSLFIKNRIEALDSLVVTREGTEISSIYVEADVSGVKMKGSVGFFSNDQKFGSGFDGSLALTFLDATTVQGTVLFGNVKENNATTTYWYAFGMVGLSTPFPLATPLDLYAFGGGAYWNMELNGSPPGPRTMAQQNVNPRNLFNVKKNTAGIQAAVILGLTPESTTFNADATLTVQFNTNTGGLGLIALNGNGYVMEAIETASEATAMVYTTLEVMYNFSTKTFSADLVLKGKVPKANPLFEVDGPLSFYRSPSLWYFKAGWPTNPIGLGIDVYPLSATAGAYFMTGQQLPPPVLPAEVQDFFNFTPNMMGNLAQGLGIGFMAGAHIAAKGDFTALGTGLQVDVLCGADLAMMSYELCTCNGSTDFGINKWYAQGMAYLIGGARLTAFTADIASIKVGIIVEAAFPRPNYVHGIIRAEAEVLWWDTDIEEDFTVGTPCDMQPLPNANVLIQRLELELESLDMIAGITPSHMSSFVPLTAQPVINWHVKQGEQREYVYPDGMGGLIQKKFRFNLGAKWLRQNDQGSFVEQSNFQIDQDTENDTWTLRLVTASGAPSQMNGSRGYKVRATAAIEEWVGTGWQAARYLQGTQSGQPIVQQREHFFTTTTSLTELDLLTIDYTKPYPRQRFLPYNDLPQGIIKFNIDQQPRFQDFTECGFDLFMRMERIDGQGAPVEVPVNRDYELKVLFDMPTLQAEKIYDISIVARREATPTQLQNETRPACQLSPSNLQLLMPNVVNVSTAEYQTTVSLDSYAGMQQYTAFDPTGAMAAAGIEGTVTQEKKLHTIHFRTSKYATGAAKLNSIQPVGVTPVNTYAPYYTQNGGWVVLKDLRIALTAGEGFDRYDVLGHPFVASGSFTSAVYEFGSDHCTFDGSYGNVWTGRVCSEIYGLVQQGSGMGSTGGGSLFNPAQAAVVGFASSLPKLGKVDLRADATAPAGIKHLEPLLSDSEVGLSGSTTTTSTTPTTFPVFQPLYDPFAPTMPIQPTPATTRLELVWRPERSAYEALTMIQNNQLGLPKPPAGYQFPHMTDGNYPLHIRLNNISNSIVQSTSGTRTLQLNIDL